MAHKKHYSRRRVISYTFGFQLRESEVVDYKPKEGATELLVVKKKKKIQEK